MFYSETLLQKSGPLARVWLSANLERKLSKTHILQSDLGESIEAILTPSQAPMALRLSGQLLLGVVRIYSRKTRYLLDDCNEALMKIKMAFRSSGNNDMTVNLNVSNREALLLPDRITPYDNLDILPPPDAAWLLAQMDDVTSTPMGRKGRVNNREINLQEDFSNSQFMQSGVEKDDELALAPLDDGVELELDFGDGLDFERPRNVDRSIEMGRDAAPPMDDDIFSELDLGTRPGKEGGDQEPSISLDFDNGVRIADDEGDIQMGDDDLHFNMDDQSAMPAGPHISRARISESPLSDIDEDLAREVEEEVTRHNQTDLYEPTAEDDTTMVRRPAQRARKQKVILPDEQTMLSSSYIKEQHANRENILKPQSFLPKDPYVIALREMHKNGGFVANFILGGRSSAWAPELRTMLSITGSKQSNDLKRKRDSGIADMDSDQGLWKSPRLDVDDDDHLVLGDADAGNQTVGADGTILEIPADDQMDDGHEREGSPMPAFDETTAPLVHPADSGLVSVGTKHAVHILRDLFGADAEHDAEKRKKTAVVFQDLLPEGQTTKADATKMFFECLVLATKDAIKVEQGSDLGAPIRVRGKRGLWGEWAEREAGGEIATEAEEQAATSAQAPEAQPLAVSVES
ncbi:hypothetical protein jhhlp_002203 [Lomentospora prolificans]|uniref:Rad21/Rec8-like protein N-terminal domain-containing protein n=1 Tax=Lomentospora prolificans TaxID=41688 RepID=A0A2N3NDM0_9PEZI|nr:hypothetical protein jhhlp_002203 [Lomentospora prolificans]